MNSWLLIAIIWAGSALAMAALWAFSMRVPFSSSTLVVLSTVLVTQAPE